MKNIHVLPTDKPTWLHKSLLTGILRKSSSSINDMRQAQGINIYITSDEEIKEGDWKVCLNANLITKYLSNQCIESDTKCKDCKKIILTTDEELQKDGVQAIDDEFLEWFIKNPSCESVEVRSEILYEHKDTYRPYPSECKNLTKTKVSYYLSIIPKEEFKEIIIKIEEDAKIFIEALENTPKPNKKLKKAFKDFHKQETLEEVAENYGWTIKTNTFSNLVKANELAESAKQDFITGAKWQQEKMFSAEDMKQAFLDGLFYSSGGTVENAIEEWFEQFKKK